MKNDPVEKKRANELAKKLELFNKRLVILEKENEHLQFELTIAKAGCTFEAKARAEDAVMYESRIRELGGEGKA